MLAVALILAASAVPATPDRADLCVPYAQFEEVVTRGGGRITSTIETPSFPQIKSLIIVTYKGTKQVFGRADCVLVPALYIDYPPGMSPVPVIKFLPDKPASTS